MQQYLEKCPTTFTVKKTKEVGLGCACKNNRCIRKYCECFRSNLKCTAKCSCRQCANGKHDGVNTSNSTSVGGSLDVTALYPDDDVHEVHKI